MEWSKKAPTQEGTYWLFRGKGHRMELAIISKQDDIFGKGLYVDTRNGPATPLKFWVHPSFRWQGPIQTPQEPTE